MREDEDHGVDEPEQGLDGFAVRNVSEFLYAGRPAVTVRTTHLHVPEEERQVRSDARRPPGDGPTVGPSA
jgi:hypothetical protein